MKKLLSLAALTSLFVASQASAITYYADVDGYLDLSVKVSVGDSFTSDFNIVDNGGDSLFDIFSPLVTDLFGDGYDPATQMITSAWAYFLVSDDTLLPADVGTEGPWVDHAETVAIDLGGVLFGTPVEVNHFTLTGGSLSALVDLDADGILSYTVSSTTGDFYLLGAGLKATVTDRQGVPDSGSSFALLGLGVLGLVGLRRRFAK